MKKNLLKGLAHLVAATAIVVAMVIGLSTNVKAATTYTIHYNGTNWDAAEMAAAVGAVKGDVIKIVNESATDAKYRTAPSSYASAYGISTPAPWNMGGTVATLNSNNTLEFSVPAGFYLQECKETNAGGLFLDMKINPTYTVSFNANGGSGTQEPVTDVYGTYILPLSTTFTPPTTGKVFDGWADGWAYGPTITTPTINVTSNKTLYAKWATGVTVSFDPGEGSGTQADETVASGATYILPISTTFIPPAGKVFAGWSEVLGGPKIAGTTITVGANKTLYALWKEGSAPTPSSAPDKSEKKSSKESKIEISPYMIAFLMDIVNKNKAQAVAVEAPQTVVVDKDTCKSEAPHNTAGVSNTNSKIGDLKVHTVNATTEANQKLLVNSFAAQQGKRARILVNASVHPRRELGVDAGKKEVLSWANLEKVAQPVYAVCYNETDKAYYISGVLDNNGVANLNDFILRDATNVTIFVLE